jgi:hypothetical protein
MTTQGHSITSWKIGILYLTATLMCKADVSVYRLNCSLIYMRQLCLAVCQIGPHIFFITVTARVFLNFVEDMLVTLELLYDSSVKMNC